MASTRRNWRPFLFERDRGVCARCRCDTEAMRQDIERQANEYARIVYGPLADRPIRIPPLCDGDHIIPLSEGGQDVPENMRTLCLACHKIETAKLQGRLAIRRRRHAYRPHIPDELAGSILDSKAESDL